MDDYILSKELNDIITYLPIVRQGLIFEVARPTVLYFISSVRISVANQKGGSGKSLVALMLAVGLNKKNEDVQLVDLDPQGSLIDLAEMIDFTSIKGGDFTVMDTPPTVFNRATEQAIRDSDLVVVPTSPSVADVRVTMSTLPLIQGFNKNVVVVLNKVITVNKAGKSLDEVKDYIRDKAGVAVATNHIKHRSVYQHDFLTDGFKGLNRDAKDELQKLVVELTDS